MVDDLGQRRGRAPCVVHDKGTRLCRMRPSQGSALRSSYTSPAEVCLCVHSAVTPISHQPCQASAPGPARALQMMKDRDTDDECAQWAAPSISRSQMMRWHAWCSRAGAGSAGGAAQATGHTICTEQHDADPDML